MRGHKRSSAHRSGESGAALIEMAVVLPIVLTIGLGVIEFANYFYAYQMIQYGLRDAARYASSKPVATTTAELDYIRNLAATGNPAGGTNRLSWWHAADVSVEYPTPVSNPTLSGGLRTYRYAGGVPRVIISTSVPYPSLGFLGYLKIGSITLNASHEERVLGAR